MNFAKIVVHVMLLLEPVHHYFRNQLYSFKLQSIFFRGMESTLTLTRSAAPPRVLPTQPQAVQLRSPGLFNDGAAGRS
uniref:Uncharacterized protein n=1 Tax=Triticum urartu TaxID=4572 RepID=A0A8R7PWR1_TRIUA